MKTQIFKYLLSFLLLTLVASCRKNIPEGIETTITGKVYDPKTNKPIVGATVGVQEYKRGTILYGPTFNGIIDSTRTDNDGNYKITFTTTGTGVEYHLSFGPGKNYDPVTVPIKLNVGKDTVINFLAFEIHTLKARVIVVNNYNPPLRVYTRLSTLETNQVLSTSADTTFFIKVLPDQFNEIYFNIRNVDTPSLVNVRIDTILLQGFTDTFQRTFQVDPKLFTKRL